MLKCKWYEYPHISGIFHVLYIGCIYILSYNSPIFGITYIIYRIYSPVMPPPMHNRYSGIATRFFGLSPWRETCVRGTPRRGNEHIAQGNRRRSESRAELAPAIPSEEEEDEVIALGMMKRWTTPWKGKSVRIHGFASMLLPLQGAFCGGLPTQGDALGYALAGPSARSLNACQLQVNTCEV